MLQVEKLQKTLGGLDVIGVELKTPLDVVQVIRTGLPAQVVDYVILTQHVTRQEVEAWIIPRSTLALRKKKHLPLTSTESEHVIRLARILVLAQETFGEDDKANRWLRRPNRVFNNMPPFTLLDTEEGARMIEDTLGQIAHGLFN